VAHDLSGWRISGDVDYLFPSGTVLAGRSYLVVASDPAALQARYGVAGIRGPFLGNLPNDRGTVRLRDNIGALLLEIQYADAYPWPVAADGAGHALQLAKPDFGEGSARAWSASSFAGGSPGRSDPLDLSPLRQVVINEVLYNTDLPQMDFIEVFNRGTQTVDISRCTLSNTLATNKFRIPDSTVVAPGGLAIFRQDTLGFSLNGHGDEVYLASADGNFVIDAVRFGPGETGVSLGRFPDGAEWRHELSSPTPGATNAALLIRDIVINEIMYHPISGDDRDEYVELHNRSSAPVDLSHWQFTDGIALVFPEGTIIAPHGYLVAAKDAARLKARYPGLNGQNTVGDYGGSLSDRGERLALARPLDPAAPNTDLVLVDEVIYGDGEDWGRWTDGGGSSLELTDPSSDNRLAMNWRGSDESHKSTNLWTHLAQTRMLQGGNGLANELHIFLMGAGECLIDNVVVQKAGGAPLLSEGFESGTTGWQFWGNHVRSSLESGEGHQSSRSLHLRASGAGEATGGDSVGEGSSPTYNRVTMPLGTGFAAADTVTLECRARWVQGSPVLVLGLKGLWMEAAGLLQVPANLGTPGAPNSRLVANAGPAVWDVAHAPVLPRAAQAVLVTCRAHDTDGIASLSLRYRLDPSTAPQTAPMRDDGLGGDALAHDGAYTATLPGQPAGTLLAFILLATDARGATTQFPEPGLTGASRRECLIRFSEVELAGTLGSYRMWMSSNNVKAWTSRPTRSDEPLDMTFVSGTDRVIYNASVRYRGNWRGYNGPDSSTRCSYSVDFSRSDRFLGDNEVKLDLPGQNGADSAIQRERHSSWFAAALGLPASNLRFVHVFFNGSDRGVNGLLTDKDIPGRTFFTSVYGDPDPLYFENTRFANDRTQFSPLSDVRNADGTRKKEYYRWYFGRGPTDVPSDDYEPLYNLIDALDTPDARLYTVKAQALIDLDNWMGIFAVNHIIGNGDSISWRNSKNTAVYAPPAGLARMFLIDTDQSFGIGVNSGASEDLFTCNDAVIARMLNHPPFRRIFWRYAEEAVKGPMLAAQHDPEVEAWFNALQAEGATPSRDSTTTMKTYVSGRRAYIISLLAGVNVPFRLTLNGGAAFSTNRNLVELTGAAPVAVATITVNGVPYSVTWDSVNQWRLQVVLAPGDNALLIAGLDRHGNPVTGASATMHITFTGNTVWPVLRINEWMADNAGFLRDPADGKAQDWFELYNPNASAVDLKGWFLSDLLTNRLAFKIPDTCLIPAGGFLLVWADGEPDQNATNRPDLHVNFKLEKAGEAIVLSAPDGTLIDAVEFKAQAADLSEGRVPGQADLASVLAFGTPRAANAAPPAPPAFQGLVVGGASVTLRLGTVSNFTYRVEYQDLPFPTNWIPLGSPARAPGSTLIISDVLTTNAQRFYRAVRTP
jgi:hypothetical protein